MAPRKLRRPPASDQLADLHRDLRSDLESGRSFWTRFETKEAMQGVWDTVGGEVLSEWIAKHPGTRPYAWWLFEHGHERPIQQFDIDPDLIARLRAEARFGFLSTHIHSGRDFEPLQQPDAEYLQTHGLLEPGEYDRYLAERADQ